MQGYTLVAGLDEVGRGCLAGPVVAGAVILPEDNTIEADLFGVRDSKELSATRRVTLAHIIRDRALAWSIGIGDITAIEQLNILGATRHAMHDALSQLQPQAQALLLDAIRLPRIPLPQVPLIKGDRRSLSIAAASILAKVARDALMEVMDVQHPGYGFAQHKGYGTPQHLTALTALGPCAIHRRTFAPVKAAITVMSPPQVPLLEFPH